MMVLYPGNYRYKLLAKGQNTFFSKKGFVIIRSKNYLKLVLTFGFHNPEVLENLKVKTNFK